MHGEGQDCPAGAQEAAVRLLDPPVMLTQSILGQERERPGVSEEERQAEPLRQGQELPQHLLWRLAERLPW